MSDISNQIWDMKYRLKSPDGVALDRDIAQTWARVALAAAQAEAPGKRSQWAKAFGAALAGHKFLPAGRILAGAGTDRNVTLFNCFVMGTIEDSMDGIFSHLREAALTLQQGGGIGYDFSTLRPRGALVKGVGADASGPVSFMDVWDAMCRTIMSAGSRRGAMMATLSCDHPDIETFIAAKQTPGRLSMFNLSVLVSDDFMAAVKRDRSWNLVFGGKIYRTLRARDLWDKIMRATYDYAEPGVIFIDRINQQNNLSYCETIRATNPCLTADSWIMTAEGPRQISDLAAKAFVAIADGAPWPSDERGFFSQGRKQVVTLKTAEGHGLRLTADHKVRKVTRRTRWSCEWEWTEAAHLRPGDEIAIHNHRALDHWGDVRRREQDEAEAYLIGLLIGDGVLKTDKAILSVWPGQCAVNGGDGRPGIRGVMDAALKAAEHFPRRSDFTGWIEVPGRGEYRLALGSLRRLCLEHGMTPGAKQITPAMERRSSAFHAGLLRGLFDADGSVQGTQEKGISVRLAQSNLALLQTVQRMLLRLGIASSIYESRREAGRKYLPDGKGGMRHYPVEAQHELVVAGDSLATYAERVSFSDHTKRARLAQSLKSYKRTPNKEAFVATVRSVTPDGEAEVFDASIPGLNAFDANGLWAHNCGEQPLPPYGACLLGSINLAKLVRDPFTPSAHFDLEALRKLTATAVRLLDNMIEISRFPLPEQRVEAFAKRRIGLGVTGLADALIMMRSRYGSPQSLALIENWLSELSHSAYRASAMIAAEKGAFPLYDADEFLGSPHVAALPADIRGLIAAHGIRNGLVTSIAPTGTISLFAGNVSSGIEPVFAFTHKRTILNADGSRSTETVEDYALRDYRARYGDGQLPDYFVDAQKLSPEDHLAVQAAAQKYIDSSISKTINVPKDISFEAFKNVYVHAYDMGCKGCTTYRPNDVTGAVLQTVETGTKAKLQAGVAPMPPPVANEVADEEPVVPQPQRARDHADARASRDTMDARLSRDNIDARLSRDGGVVYMTQPLARPDVLIGQTYKIKWLDSDHAFYITVNDIEKDGRRRPFEVFINSKNMEAYAWAVALTRMISAVFRRGGDVSFVVEELKSVFDPRGGMWMSGHYVPSLMAAIGDVIEKHLVEIGFISPSETPLAPPEFRAAAVAAEGAPARFCPRCGSASFVKIEGCDNCLSCGYSKCS